MSHDGVIALRAFFRTQPLDGMADDLALLNAKPELSEAERLIRAVLMEVVICERSPAADAAFDAWTESDDDTTFGRYPMITDPMFVQARRQPLGALTDVLVLLEAEPKLDKAERLTRAVLMEVICEKSPAAGEAFDAWAADDDAPADGAVAAIIAGVQGQPARAAAERATAERARARAKAVKRGMAVKFAEPVDFGDGRVHDTLTLVVGSTFHGPDGRLYKVPHWRIRYEWEVVTR
jgi:hypothetical protein